MEQTEEEFFEQFKGHRLSPKFIKLMKKVWKDTQSLSEDKQEAYLAEVRLIAKRELEIRQARLN